MTEHLDFETDFLDKDTSSPKRSPLAHKPDEPRGEDTSKLSLKNILIGGGVVLFFLWIIFSGSGSDTNTESYITPTPVSTYSSAICDPGLVNSTVNGHCVTRDVSCGEVYSNTIWSGKQDTDGKFICDCRAGYYWNSNKTACEATVSCGLSQCSYKGTCIDKPLNSYCVSESNNAWKCSPGYYEISDICATWSDLDSACKNKFGYSSNFTGEFEGGKYMCN